ncbi:PrkA family serine protein kinase [Vulgatibacter sp.]|uniref:PrkA family serine protein kinase n=1 Tax=Vulgatibacter sp. TaxID=1971226 RepID=UPI003563F612
MDARHYLESVGSEVKSIFIENRMILSFEEWMGEFLREPVRHARSSAQYLRDALDHFGTRTVQTPMGALRRFNLFDRAFDAGQGRVAGQEAAQNEVYRILGNFIRTGRANKLILLHGPNGSAKSSIVAALSRGLEVYSRAPEGALYKINWIFPTEKLTKGSLGFGAERAGPHGELATFAHLESEDVDARIACEMKDHPLFLVPHGERRKLLQEQLGRDGGSDFVLSTYMLEGELCHKCRQIYSGLLGAYNGDFLKVLRHVQVERFYVSRRYLNGAVTVEPQVSVDASYHQVTADRSIGHLPPALQNLDIFEPFGPLVYANRGVVEFSDLLKRPIDTYKYLLGTTETGVLPMEHFLLHLDEVMIGTANDKHLSAFKDLADFASFKGRIELVQVPYLRRATAEREIYDVQVTREAVGKHIAPHATQVAAIWAVLTRLKRPEPEHYEPVLRDVIEDLAPIEKLRLYDEGRVPDRLPFALANELRKAIPAIYHEWDVSPAYEGRAGASAREIKTVIFNAAQKAGHTCLTPMAVLDELRQLCKDKSIYEFLQAEVRFGYHDPEEFLQVVEAEYLDVIDDEIRDSMGMITESQYEELFERYVVNVSHWLKGEKIANRVTGTSERPDEARMAEIESLIKPEGEDRSSFRRGLISAIGAWRLDHPSERKVEYGQVFPELFRRLRDHFFEERKRTLRRNKENVLAYLAEEAADRLEAKDRVGVEEMLRNMRERYGYCPSCARDAILLLMRRRYAD